MEELSLVELNKREIDGFFLSDKGWIHNYLPTYDKLFAPYRHKEINIFEVGYQHGGSAQLWNKYFSKAKIKIIDIDACVPLPFEERIIFELRDMRKTDAEYFSDFIPDIAIDDGSHLLEDQVHFVKTVYPVLREGGLLIVEDIQNLEQQKIVFDYLGIPFEVVDLRVPGGRYDDVFLLYRK
ncbi:MAG: class I SAM-dependent methyltransferase [Porphyromonadaceae bacterium]|nr:class I SAM-dependent methyltransferase [Porphyromonadaceae bacterium]